MSLDVNLVYNALELVLEQSDRILLNVTTHEHGISDVIIMFSTTTTAYRLVMPHPERIAKVN